MGVSDDIFSFTILMFVMEMLKPFMCVEAIDIYMKGCINLSLLLAENVPESTEVHTIIFNNYFL